MLTSIRLYSHHAASAHPIVWISLINWQAFGIGIAFGGSIVLAIGLLSGAPSLAKRIISSGNSPSWQVVQVAESKADAQTGVFALALGFAIQAVTTIWTDGHAAPKLTGGWSYLITLGWVLVPILLILWVDRETQWFWVRRYLVKLARYDNMGRKNRLPGFPEIEFYGRVLGEDYMRLPDESDADYLRRVWKVRHKHARNSG